MSQFATVNGEVGNDIINDHSAASVIKYTPGEGNDEITFHDTAQLYNKTYFDDTVDVGGIIGRDNETHYYGGGLLAIDGTYTDQTYNSSGATFNVSGGGTIKVTGSCFTVRESVNGGYEYTRYWNGKKYRSHVFRDDERTTGSTVDGSVSTGRGNYDNSSFSEKYATTKALDFTEEADYIYTNFGKDKILDALGGDDYIKNWGATYSTIIGGDGNDSIFNDHTNYTAFMTIDAGTGDDYVKNNSHHVSIVGGTGNDTVFNDSTGSYVTINGDDGNDSIMSYGACNTIGGGQGNDSIGSYSDTGPASIDGGDGNDSIDNYSSKSTITGGTGKDSIWNRSSIGSASIDGGTDDDYIYH